MKRKLIGIISSFCLILVLAGVPFISACEPAVPTGELVILLTTMGGEVWGPDVGGGLDDNIKEITNEMLVIAPIEGQEPRVQPMLAERWEMSADGLTWDFYLRQGIQFNDGWGEFTAEDVLYSAQIYTREGTTGSYAPGFRVGEGMESYEIVSPYHIRFHLTKPQPEMEYHLCETNFGEISKKYYEAVGFDYAIMHPIGTSPWRLIEHKPAEYVKYEAVENHWRQTPEFKYLTIKEVPELSTQLAMLKTGVADFAEVPIEFAAEMEAVGFQTKRREGGGSAHLLLGGQVLPTREGYDPTCPWVTHQDEAEALADHEAGWGKVTGGSEWNQRALKVRMAMLYAINADAIIDNIFYGEGGKVPIGAAGGWASLGSVWLRPEWKLLPYDSELAKQLLIEAGYPDGFEIRFTIFATGQQPRLEEIAEAVARDWEAIGLTVKREMTEYAVERPIWGARGNVDAVTLRVWPAPPEPWGDVDYCYSTTNEAYNDGYESLELDAMSLKCSTTVDYDERLEATLEMGDFLYARYIGPSIVLTNAVYALSPEVEDIPVGISPFEYRLGWFEYATRAD